MDYYIHWQIGGCTRKRGLASFPTSPLEFFILLLMLKNLFPNMNSLISGTN